MINLNAIETFILIVETKSFTRAAKARGISRAAASKHLALLEDRLGASLLTRSTREVSLTYEGNLVYEECRKTLENLAQIEAILSGLKDEPSGSLSVVSGPVFAHKYILPYLADFLHKYPKISLKLDFRHAMPNLVEEKVDIAVGVYGIGSPDLIQTSLIMARRLLCASPYYLKKSGTPKVPEDLFKHSVIMHPIKPGDSIIEFKKGKKLDVLPQIVINDQLAIKKCILDGMGIGFMQSHVVKEELQKGQLIEVLSDWMDIKNNIPIHLFYLQRRHLSSKVRLFIDFLKKNCGTNTRS